MTAAADRSPDRVNVSVALDLDEYAALRNRCDQLATALGVPRVHGSTVLRALLAELRTDDALVARVAAALPTVERGRRAA